MKTSFISSLAMQNSMRSTILKAQLEMTNLNTELTTGKHADIGVTLGANTARSIDLNRDVERLSSIIDVNSMATTRVSTAQTALKSINDAGNSIQKVLVPNTDSTQPSLGTVRDTITGAFETFTNAVNVSVSGEYLFAGINTDVRPMDDYFAEGSTLKAGYEAELNYFMSTQTPPVSAVENLNIDQVKSFMTEIEAKFNGTSKLTNPPHALALVGKDFWTTFGSSASDTNMTSRISQTEVVESSTNSNSSGTRYFAFTAITALTFLDEKIDQNIRETVASQSITSLNKGMGGLTKQSSALGLSEERIKVANTSLQAQKKIIETHLIDLEGVDTYEAKTRLDLLQQQIEIAYSLTSRLQQMSLVNYL
jgi:flagellar hook-associated protein 3 FlgL